MKKKTEKKKLVLSKETVRRLEERALSVVAGASYDDTSCFWRLCFETGQTNCIAC